MTDPILARRERVDRISALGKRIGYSLFAVAIVLFVVGFVVGFRPVIVTPIVAAMVVGSIILAPAIVFAYGVKAANREERGGSFH
ncbi:MAG: hypothetical protein OEU32_00555 [Acidimicrobiia bacterium]|nr:hypothetical protein [Acidimicrobiia bacterium]